MPDDLRPPPENAQLLPCPFCGQPATFRRGFWGGPTRPELFSSECRPCDAQIANYQSAPEAIAAWNRRAAVSINPEDARLVNAALEVCAAQKRWIADQTTFPGYAEDVDAAIEELDAVLKALSDA